MTSVTFSFLNALSFNHFSGIRGIKKINTRTSDSAFTRNAGESHPKSLYLLPKPSFGTGFNEFRIEGSSRNDNFSISIKNFKSQVGMYKSIVQYMFSIWNEDMIIHKGVIECMYLYQ